MALKNKIIVQKIKLLPRDPGVYIFRDKNRKIIYVGKAIKLKNRVSNYFQEREHDAKTKKLIANIADLEYLTCDSEIEALILESELIKRYKPRYNIDWKDDKNYSYIKITNEDYPRVFVVRDTNDASSRYFGPFVDTPALKKSLKLLRRIFPFCTCSKPSDQVCLYYHLHLCCGHGDKYQNSNEYQKTIRQLIKFLGGNRSKIILELTREMKKASKNQEFEQAAAIRDKLNYLDNLKFIPIEEQKRDTDQDRALKNLQNILGLENTPNRIECFDISNIYGHLPVGSMVVFSKGIPNKKDYRRFEVKTVNKIDDFAMLKETIGRRLANLGQSKDSSFNEAPDVIIIDGGKGQLSTIVNSFQKRYPLINFASLAKKNEELYIVFDNKMERICLPQDSSTLYLLQRIRDEAHRFAISYHRNLRSKEITVSILDSIPGIGPRSKKDLIKAFGTIEEIKKASILDLTLVIGRNRAERIKEDL